MIKYDIMQPVYFYGHLVTLETVHGKHGYEQHIYIQNMRRFTMPKTKLQSFIFTAVMAFVMVYAMICYNIALNIGGMTNQVFIMAFHEMIIMWPIAIILEYFIIETLAKKITFRLVDPKVERPILIKLVLCSSIVCLMCPIMSFIATVLFKDAGTQIIAVWLQTAIFNFPMALGWQIFFGGALVRMAFSKLN